MEHDFIDDSMWDDAENADRVYNHIIAKMLPN